MSSRLALAVALPQMGIIQRLERLVQHLLEALVERMAHLVPMEDQAVAVEETSELQEAGPLDRVTREEQMQLLATAPEAVAEVQERLVAMLQRTAQEALEEMDQAHIQPGQRRQALGMTAATTLAAAAVAVALLHQEESVLVAADVVREELRQPQQPDQQTQEAEAAEIMALLQRRQQVVDQES